MGFGFGVEMYRNSYRIMGFHCKNLQIPYVSPYPNPNPDFGASAELSHAAANADGPVGTPHYMAPALMVWKWVDRGKSQ